MAITNLKLRTILNSRGSRAIEAEFTANDITAKASAPSGASVGKHEVPAYPLGDASKTIEEFESKIKRFIGEESNYHEIDNLMQEIDPEHKKYGASLSIAVSLAAAKLHAKVSEISMFELFADENFTLPFPLGNIIGGGVHAGKGTPQIQEFLSIPVGAGSFEEAAFANARVHKIAGGMLSDQVSNFTRGRNDEGAWAPKLDSVSALDILSSACERASDELGIEIKPALDVAASEFYDKKEEKYIYKHKKITAEEQIDLFDQLCKKFKIFSIEDPFYEEDFTSFAELNNKLKGNTLVVGDDLTTTNSDRLETAVEKKSINAVIIKPNQIGSLTETEKVINQAKEKEITPMVSHRSGETTDVSISHISVGFSIPVIKTGTVGGERIAKLNELIRIEDRENLKLSTL
ncbi:MAG: hypothetical protein R6U26_01230 [Candidatus Undinarchaeales archaeon]